VELKIGHFGKCLGYTWEVLQCGVGEGWRRSFEPIVWEMKMCYKKTRMRGMSCVQWKEGRLNGLVTNWVGTTF